MSYRTLLVVALVAFATCLTSAKVAEASFIVKAGDLIRLYDTPNRVSNGGEFGYGLVNSAGTPISSQLRTFCCEMDEFMNFNNTYKIASIGTVTKDTNRSLTVGVASLYRQWHDGLMSGANTVTLGSGANSAVYTYNTNAVQRGKDGRALQLAIWKGMGYNPNLGSDAAISAKANTWISYISSMNSSSNSTSDFFGVRIMNLVNPTTGAKIQDQLTAVPEPGSLGVAFCVVAGAGALARRKRTR